MLQYIRLIMPTQYVPAGRSASEIAADVETAVRDGRLHPGDALPPVRVLAAELGLSPATVAAAYRDLRLKGIAGGTGGPARGSPVRRRRRPGRRSRCRQERATCSAGHRIRGCCRCCRSCGAARAPRSRRGSTGIRRSRPGWPALASEQARGRRHRSGQPGRRQRRAGRRRAHPWLRGCAPATGSRSRIPATRRCLTCSRPWTWRRSR